MVDLNATEPAAPALFEVQNVSRRSILRGFGIAAAGLSLGVFSKSAEAGTVNSPAIPPLAQTGLHPNVFIQIAPSGIVTLVCHRSEMGQGVRSSLPALLAEELGADLGAVKVAQGDGDQVYGDQDTDGSSSVRNRYQELRQAGATGRAMLITAAARKWGVAESSCEARNSLVTHAASNRSFKFGELVEEAAKLPVPDPKKVRLRSDDEFQYIGKQLALLDGPDIVTGRAQFGADIQLPGLLVAVIARPPVVGGTIARLDDTKAKAIPGVRQIVQLKSPSRPYGFKPLGGVAVIADNTWAAMRGRAALEVIWDGGENGGYDSTQFREELTKTVTKRCKQVRNVGDFDKAFAAAPKKVEALYATPHFAHATMEPPCATASVAKDGKSAEIWAATQNPQAARNDAAKALDLEEKDVTVHVTLLGGGFGRKSKTDFVTEAALLSKAAGAPVRLQWTREDDLRHDYYLSTSVQSLAAGIDASNKIVAWRHRTAFPPIPSLFTNATFSDLGELQQGVLDVALDIPNVRAENGEAKAYTRIGWLRSVANIYHAFAAQTFIDELSYARGVDPRDNLLEVIGPPRLVSLKELGVDKLPNYGASLDQHPVDAGRLRHVLERVTEISGWKDRKQAGRVMGLAAHRSFLTYVAVVVSVVKSPDGKLRVDEAWSVADAGQVINLERVRSQFEGAVIFGMSLANYGAITMKAGAVEQSNFHDHRLLRIAEAPRKIHVEIIESHLAPCGVGEPGVPPVAPALGNALFALTGKRARELPFILTHPV
jgi:isoquinoline 1-oxidoreductase beta subunit